MMYIILFCQERGLSLYEDQELKDYEDGESSTVSLRDAISLAVPDETSSGTYLGTITSSSSSILVVPWDA